MSPTTSGSKIHTIGIRLSHGGRPTKGVRRTLSQVVVIAIVVYTLIPIIWILLTSFKNPVDVMVYPPKVFFKATWDHYLSLIDGRYGNFVRYYANTAVVALGTSFIAITAGGLLACYLSRFDPPRSFRNLVMGWVLFVYAIPPITLTIPFYDMLSVVNLINTRFGLMLAHITGTFPYAVWMLRTFFSEIPRELEEAAMVDGLTKLQAQWYVVMPMAAPGIAATAIFTMILSWNELPQALVLTENAAARTMPVGILGFIQENVTLWGPMSAASIVALIPVFIVTLASQRHLVRGFGFGLKE